MTDDPERLVADALRAHAARTPLPEPKPAADSDSHSEDGPSPVLGSYGLLSGSGVTLHDESERTLRGPVVAEPATAEPESSIGVGWVVLLALLLGLAAGAVVGLLTLV